MYIGWVRQQEAVWPLFRHKVTSNVYEYHTAECVIFIQTASFPRESLYLCSCKRTESINLKIKKRMIKVENLTKVFHTDEVETHALNGVSLEVQDGEFVAVMGPSGCGKSTLLNILGLLDNPTSGHYSLDGHEVGGLRERERTLFRRGRIGFVFQSFNLIDELNVEENVELPLKALGVPAKERRQRVGEILRQLKMSHRAHHYPQQLSGV